MADSHALIPDDMRLGQLYEYTKSNAFPVSTEIDNELMTIGTRLYLIYSTLKNELEDEI